MSKGLIGIIGGSGFYQMDGVKITEEKRVVTPFGEPSDAIMMGKLDATDIAFIPRHGRGHRIPPHKLNFRANIFALKKLGVKTLISISAVGSMKENIHPGDLVVVDQFLDRTKGRVDTFFDDGLAVHVSFADPVCSKLRSAAVAAAKSENIPVHDGGTYVCIEGPAFSSRAESLLYRTWGVDVIGMTNYQEAKLAREAEMCFTTIALSTDYDCWHVDEGPVDVAMIIKTLSENVKKAQTTIRKLLSSYTEDDSCPCHSSLKYAIMTDKKAITPESRQKVGLLIEKYI